MIYNKDINEWVLLAQDLCKSNKVVWIDGIELETLRNAALESSDIFTNKNQF